MITRGTTSGSIRSVAIGIAGTLTAFTLYNTSGGAIVVNVGIGLIGSYEYKMFNYNLAASGTAGSSVYEETKLTVPAGAQIVLVSSGSIDYIIQID